MLSQIDCTVKTINVLFIGLMLIPLLTGKDQKVVRTGPD